MTRIFPKVKSMLNSAGYVLYDRPGELNIVAIRSARSKPDRFDDELHVFYRQETAGSSPAKSLAQIGWNYHVYKVTTDPGTYWLNTANGNALGTAILSQGQYIDAYAIGLHKSLYPALVQVGDVTVIRDYDWDARLDFRSKRLQKGKFGINIHRAAAKGKTIRVGEWSAGCTVFADADAFGEFMILCNRHRELYGNQFTYTLFDWRDKWRERFRRVFIGAAAGSVIYGAYKLTRNTHLLKFKRKKQTA